MAGMLYGVILVARIHHIGVRFPAPGVGTTYVIAVSSSVPDTPPAGTDTLGVTDERLGKRVVAVLIIHELESRNTVLSVPVDLLVSPTFGSSEGLTQTLRSGPQALVDGLCNTLGVAASRLVIGSSSGFSSIVDTLGGVNIDLPHPLRDPSSGLNLMQTGTVHLNGAQALGLLLLRQPQTLINGKWVAVPDGAAQRTDWAAGIFNSLADAAKSHIHNLWAMQRLAWTATASLTVSRNTGVFDLFDLARLHGEAVPLPTRDIPRSRAVQADGSTRTALAAAGYGGSCTPTRPR
jgi:LCP family protein required for cell wall assembly